MAAAIRLHHTRAAAVRPLQPRRRDKVGIYACGPIVYGRIHVGNAGPFVVFSLPKRLRVHDGWYEVTLVVNITVVNDEIYAAAATRSTSLVGRRRSRARMSPGGKYMSPATG